MNDELVINWDTEDQELRAAYRKTKSENKKEKIYFKLVDKYEGTFPMNFTFAVAIDNFLENEDSREM